MRQVWRKDAIVSPTFLRRANDTDSDEYFFRHLMTNLDREQAVKNCQGSHVTS